MREKKYVSFGVSETESSQNLVNMEQNAICIAYVVQTGLFFLLLIVGHPYGGKVTGPRELSIYLQYAFRMATVWFAAKMI